jgi:hypothetical protein
MAAGDPAVGPLQAHGLGGQRVARVHRQHHLREPGPQLLVEVLGRLEHAMAEWRRVPNDLRNVSDRSYPHRTKSTP